tara:strand:+ start:72 stop:500 length:429 start_codon:yes stop_codon:yes gene_type:complete
MRENPIYTVTPPDMMLPDRGPIITLLTTEQSFVDQVETLYENLFKSVPITLYHPGGIVNDSNSGWLMSMARFSDTLYIDLDSINELGIVVSLMANTNKVFITKTNKRKSIVKLLNTKQSAKCAVFEDLNEYAEMMLDSMHYE